MNARGLASHDERMTRVWRLCCASSAKNARNFSRLDHHARFGPIYSREDLVFGWLDFPLPEFGLRYQEPPKLGLLPGHAMSAWTVVIRSEDARWLQGP